MSARIAQLVFATFIILLFRRDLAGRRECSWALWIPFVWMVLIGSRPFSMWLHPVALDESDSYLEGSPLDRMIFLVLIVAGVMVLAKRGVNLATVFKENKWLCVFYVYLAVSILWSDFPFVSFKRWVKDSGNLIMVLVLLSERDPVLAVRTVFVRLAYLLIPLSLLFIKYMPELGRVYNHWTWIPSNVGVTTNKNELGALVMVTGLFLFWKLIGMFGGERGVEKGVDRFLHLIVAAMALYLFHAAGSATSLSCAVLGAGLLLAMRLPSFESRFGHLEVLGVAALAGFLMLNSFFDLPGLLLGLVGRDPTLTGRTDIWDLVLRAGVNPLLGVGFYSFWLGNRAEVVWSAGYEKLNQSHNGYLETYLNSGLVGVFLLAILLLSAYASIRRRLSAGYEYDQVRYVFLLIVIAYNFTEAAFNRMGLVWFVALVAMTNSARSTAELKDVEVDDGPAARQRGAEMESRLAW